MNKTQKVLFGQEQLTRETTLAEYYSQHQVHWSLRAVTQDCQYLFTNRVISHTHNIG